MFHQNNEELADCDDWVIKKEFYDYALAIFIYFFGTGT